MGVPARPATGRCSPTWLAAKLSCRASDEHVAAGACVQAAAVLTGTEPAEIADSWGLRAGEVVEPGPGSTDAEQVRASYASGYATPDYVHRRAMGTTTVRAVPAGMAAPLA